MGTVGLEWLLSDHLGSTSITANSSGAETAEMRYMAWGEVRYSSGTTPTDFTYTGQRSEMDGLGLMYYGARWYDPALGRFVQPDSIVPGVGEGDNPNAVGCLGASNYAALTVDYHENQLLDQLSTENKARLLEPDFKLPPVPTNPIAFDRYTYTLNNPIRYTDPSGHCPFCAPFVLALGASGPVGWVVLGVAAVATVAFVTTGGPEAFGEALYQAKEAAGDAIEDATSDKRNDENQEALVDLAQEAKQRGGVSEEDAQTLMDWADEYNVLPHTNHVEQHPNRKFNVPHIRIGPVNHIPVPPR